MRIKSCQKCTSRFKGTHGRAKFCSVECYMATSVNIQAKTNCWIWAGAVDSYGYAHAHWNGVRKKAHILAFELSGRILRPGLVVRHVCNNGRCCNPDHLVAGTPLQNMADKSRSGIISGENNPNALISNKAAIEIFARRNDARATDIARLYKVSPSTVRSIWTGASFISATGAPRIKAGRRVGDRNPSAKLTNAQALEVFDLKGKVPRNDVASKYGICAATVGHIWNGRSFHTVTGLKPVARTRTKKAAKCVLCKKQIGFAMGSSKYCSIDCAFWFNVKKGAVDECWPWSSKSKARSYGQILYRGTRVYAHQFAFDLANPDLARRRKEEHLTVGHTCHRPDCCNPKHLRLQTLLENINDNRGRANISGENNHGAKMTMQVARRICELLIKGHSMREIVSCVQSEQGVLVTHYQIVDIKRMKTWKTAWPQK